MSQVAKAKMITVKEVEFKTIRKIVGKINRSNLE